MSNVSLFTVHLIDAVPVAGRRILDEGAGAGGQYAGG